MCAACLALACCQIIRVISFYFTGWQRERTETPAALCEALEGVAPSREVGRAGSGGRQNFKVKVHVSWKFIPAQSSQFCEPKCLARQPF